MFLAPLRTLEIAVRIWSGETVNSSKTQQGAGGSPWFAHEAKPFCALLRSQFLRSSLTCGRARSRCLNGCRERRASPGVGVMPRIEEEDDGYLRPHGGRRC